MKIRILAIALMFVMLFCAPAAAEETQESEAWAWEETVKINGGEYAPVRALFDTIGGEVFWNGEAKAAEASFDGISCILAQTDERVELIDGKLYAEMSLLEDEFSLYYYFDEGLNSMAVKADKNGADDKELLFEVRFDRLMPENENYVFSPLSIKYALAMAGNGADQEVRQEIENALGIESIESFNAEVKEALEGASTGSGELEIANSVWLNNDTLAGAEFSEKFKNLLKQNYNAEVYNVNNENAVSEINGWCDEKTKHKIPQVIENPDFLACLINTVYFKDEWVCDFKPEMTAEDIFTQKNGETAKAQFMNQTEFFMHYEGGDAKILKMPYKSGRSMYVVMTDNENFNINDYKERLERHRVQVSIPKFKTETTTDCIKALRKMGVKAAFDEREPVHFNDMFNAAAKDKVYISDVIQKAYIEVDEKGTEAAAVTVVAEGATSALIPDEIYSFKADRPFKYYITDNSGEVLFMGEYAYAE